MEISLATMAQMNRVAYASLGKAATELGDKVTWRPLDKGRSAWDQVLECAGMAQLMAESLEKQQPPVFDRAAVERLKEEYNTGEKAIAFLNASVDRFAAAIVAYPEEKLSEKVTMPWGAEMSYAELIMLVYWNAVYHEGQVNYIHTLL